MFLFFREQITINSTAVLSALGDAATTGILVLFFFISAVLSTADLFI